MQTSSIQCHHNTMANIVQARSTFSKVPSPFLLLISRPRRRVDFLSQFLGFMQNFVLYQHHSIFRIYQLLSEPSQTLLLLLLIVILRRQAAFLAGGCSVVVGHCVRKVGQTVPSGIIMEHNACAVPCRVAPSHTICPLEFGGLQAAILLGVVHRWLEMSKMY